MFTLVKRLICMKISNTEALEISKNSLNSLKRVSIETVFGCPC